MQTPVGYRSVNEANFSFAIQLFILFFPIKYSINFIHNTCTYTYNKEIKKTWFIHVPISCSRIRGSEHKPLWLSILLS